MKKLDREVLKALVDHRHENEGWMYTFDVAQTIGLGDIGAAKLYVPFMRLEQRGLIEFRWDPAGPQPPELRRAQRRAKPDRIFEVLEELERKSRKKRHRTPALGGNLRPRGVDA